MTTPARGRRDRREYRRSAQASCGASDVAACVVGGAARAANSAERRVAASTASINAPRTPAALERRAARRSSCPRRGDLVLEQRRDADRSPAPSGGAEHGLRRQQRGHVAGQADPHAAVGERLDHQVDKRRPAPGEPGDGVEQRLGHADRLSHGVEKRPDDRLVLRVKLPAQVRYAEAPSPTRAGVLGMTRTTRTFVPSPSTIDAIVIPAAIETTRCSAVTRRPKLGPAPRACSAA